MKWIDSLMARLLAYYYPYPPVVRSETPQVSPVISKMEKARYELAWISGEEGNSRTAYHFSQFVSNRLLARNDEKILDIGCGNGLVVSELLSVGFDIYGTDITLAGLKQKFRIYSGEATRPPRLPPERFVEAPAWALPYPNQSFTTTLSCDVMEHIAEDLVPNVVEEIGRVTKNATIHVIATFPHRDFHKTIKPISWWTEQFSSLKKNNIRCIIMSRKEFVYKTTKRREQGL